MPGNPITGRGGPAGNPIAITIEVFQAAFIVLTAAIIIYERRKKKKKNQLPHDEKKKREIKKNLQKKAAIDICPFLLESLSH